MYYAQFPDRRLPDHRTFQRLYRQLRETRSLHVIRHDAGQLKAVRSSSLEESILRSESSTRVGVHPRVQALNPANYLLRLLVNGRAIWAAAALHSSYVEQL
ncbi:uncharacterized protein TNCV_4794651 [Trichonephila clavipes]|nr:uncharacterized protein TNCV_4794651 [Trichonephila clavipes]